MPIIIFSVLSRLGLSAPLAPSVQIQLRLGTGEQGGNPGHNFLLPLSPASRRERAAMAARSMVSPPRSLRPSLSPFLHTNTTAAFCGRASERSSDHAQLGDAPARGPPLARFAGWLTAWLPSSCVSACGGGAAAAAVPHHSPDCDAVDLGLPEASPPLPRPALGNRRRLARHLGSNSSASEGHKK